MTPLLLIILLNLNVVVVLPEPVATQVAIERGEARDGITRRPNSSELAERLASDGQSRGDVQPLWFVHSELSDFNEGGGNAKCLGSAQVSNAASNVQPADAAKISPAEMWARLLDQPFHASIEPTPIPQ